MVHFELLYVCTAQRLPLVTEGSCRRRRLKGSERCKFAEHHPVVRQNVHLLIPSVTASPCHLPLVTKGRLWYSRNVAASQNVQPFSSSGASRHLSLPPLSLRDISP